jgi:phospholipid/cholesterol/gamma-HCH transport system permease protein
MKASRGLSQGRERVLVRNLKFFRATLLDSSTLDIKPSDGQVRLVFGGALRIGDLSDLTNRLQSIDGDPVTIDLGGLEAFDTAGAWLIVDLRRRLTAEGRSVKIIGASDRHRSLIDLVEADLPETVPGDRPPRSLTDWLVEVGQSTERMFKAGLGVLNLLGQVVLRIGGIILRPWRLRWTALVHHMEEAGLNAVPIVALMSFLIGVVLAYQGATQLRQFGAEVFVVDLIAISILRELGILLTAIIVAGRSSSAFTAAIGSMKMREEIDAMRILGLDPITILVVPRILALMITLPILGFIADIAGLVGGALMAWVELGVSPGMFRVRLLEAVDFWQFLIGIIKAPFFALTIGLIGCYQGLQVEGNAESLGRLTSRSVVLSIFFVIVLDAVFSVFFSFVGL